MKNSMKLQKQNPLFLAGLSMPTLYTCPESGQQTGAWLKLRDFRVIIKLAALYPDD